MDVDVVRAELPTWKLEDAKARLSEVVRLAREHGPQRVTVRGQAAVVVLSAIDYDRLVPCSRPLSLAAAFDALPDTSDIDIEFGSAGLAEQHREIMTFE